MATGKNEKDLKTHRVTVRFSNQEWEDFQKRMQDSGAQNKTEFIKACVLGNRIKVVVVDEEKNKMVAKLSQLKTELNAVGKNINQVTRIANSYAAKGEFSPQVLQLKNKMIEFQNILERYKKTIQNLAKFIR